MVMNVSSSLQPLMRRFQASVADQLSRQHEKLELERLEKVRKTTVKEEIFEENLIS